MKGHWTPFLATNHRIFIPVTIIAAFRDVFSFYGRHCVQRCRNVQRHTSPAIDCVLSFEVDTVLKLLTYPGSF
jgi:hypothetical protein